MIKVDENEVEVVGSVTEILTDGTHVLFSLVRKTSKDEEMRRFIRYLLAGLVFAVEQEGGFSLTATEEEKAIFEESYRIGKIKRAEVSGDSMEDILPKFMF